MLGHPWTALAERPLSSGINSVMKCLLMCLRSDCPISTKFILKELVSFLVDLSFVSWDVDELTEYVA